MGKNRTKKPEDSSRLKAGVKQFRRPEKKANSKPKDLDTQEIPFKLREIIKSMKDMDKPKKKRQKPAPKQGPQHKELQTDIPVPKFKRMKHESCGAFLQRMDQETQHVLFLTKNQLDRVPETELDAKGEMVKEEVTKKKSQKKKDFDRKRLGKFLKKREERKETRLEKELFTDPVIFGEVAMQPPSLTVKPRKSVVVTKPGEKKLLLKRILGESSSPSQHPAMSFARKRLLEDERERVVQVYRDLKKKKMEQASVKKHFAL